MNYVIVRSNRLNTFNGKLNTDTTEVIDMFNFNNHINQGIVESYLKLHLDIPEKYYNQRLKNVSADTIIVFDGHARLFFLNWLRDNNPGRRLIFWCWNTVDEISDSFDIRTIPKEYEIWSYSKYDCKKYGLKYNTTFFWNKYTELSGKKIQRDVFFVGKDKGRLNKINDIKAVFDDGGITYKLNVVKTHFWNLGKGYSPKLTYNQVIDEICSSKAILDIKVNPNAGPSLRALESAFFRKKLITDDFCVKEFSFYSENNIYILGNDKRTIKTFLDTPYQEVSNKDIEKYSFRSWVRRFEQ